MRFAAADETIANMAKMKTTRRIVSRSFRDFGGCEINNFGGHAQYGFTRLARFFQEHVSPVQLNPCLPQVTETSERSRLRGTAVLSETTAAIDKADRQLRLSATHMHSARRPMGGVRVIAAIWSARVPPNVDGYSRLIPRRA